MKYRGKAAKTMRISFLPMFVTSAAMVCLYVLIKGSDLLLQTDVLEENTLILIKYRAQDCRSLLVYVMKERLGIVPFLFLMATTHFALYAVCGVVLWYGGATGALLGVAMLRYGIKGILLVIVAAIPHYILYVPAVTVALYLCNKQRTPDRSFWGQMFILEMVVIIGCILESYVNLMVMEKFLVFLNIR